MSVEKMTATNMIERQDRRRMRAASLTNFVMQKMQPYIHDVERYIQREIPRPDKYIYEAIMSAFTEHGVEIITDEARREASLPPRDDRGWTIEELRALEVNRLEIMTRPYVTNLSFDLSLPIGWHVEIIRLGNGDRHVQVDSRINEHEPLIIALKKVIALANMFDEREAMKAKK